jgi:hypothetical protein
MGGGVGGWVGMVVGEVMCVCVLCDVWVRCTHSFVRRKTCKDEDKIHTHDMFVGNLEQRKHARMRTRYTCVQMNAYK